MFRLTNLLVSIAVEALVFFFAFPSISYAESWNVSLRSTLYHHWEDGARSVALADGRAYVAAGRQGVIVLDVGDPEHPVQIGWLDVGASIEDIAMVGRLALLAAETGLYVIDVSDPAEPTEIGEWLGASFKYAAAVDSVAWLLEAEGPVWCFNLSDPRRPRVIASWNMNVAAIELTTGRIWAMGDSLIILDVSDLRQPAVIGSWKPDNGTVRDIAFAGNTALAVSNWYDPQRRRLYSYLSGIDISDPAHPRTTSVVRFNDEVFSVAATGRAAFASFGALGVRRFDISRPDNIQSNAIIDTLWNACDLAIAGNYLWIAGGLQSPTLWNIDIRNNGIDGCYADQGRIERVVAEGEMAYILASNYGAYSDSGSFNIIDVSDADHPEIIFSRSIEYGDGGLALSYPYCYLGSTLGLLVLNVSNPASPRQMRSVQIVGGAQDMVIEDDLMFIKNTDRVKVFNIANRSQPIENQTINVLGGLNALDVSGRKLYIAAVSHGLLIYDISNLGRPVEAGRYSRGGAKLSVLARDSLVFLSDQQRGVVILDVHNPADPQEISTWPVAAPGHLALLGDDVLLVGGHTLLNVSDPSIPILIGKMDSHGGRACFNGEFIYQAAGWRFEVWDAGAALTIPQREFKIHPSVFILGAPWPNPFNGMINIPFNLLQGGYINLSITDAYGRRTAILSDGWRQAGRHLAVWDAQGAPGGSYIVRLRAGRGEYMRLVNLVK